MRIDPGMQPTRSAVEELKKSREILQVPVATGAGLDAREIAARKCLDRAAEAFPIERLLAAQEEEEKFSSFGR